MRDSDASRACSRRWARLRFSIVGPLLSSPPSRGCLKAALLGLSRKEWLHPVTGSAVRFSYSTIERWYYQARRGDDPVGVLRRKSRSDAGANRCFGARLAQALVDQHRAHPGWSYRLHYDNLAVLAQADEGLGAMPSYSTVVRFMQARGLRRRRRRGPGDSPGAAAAERRFETRETRGFEVPYVHGLWHLDFHHGSRKVLGRDGQWTTPILFAALDDCSRLLCHAQWYVSETAEDLIHGLCQAFQKRGLPRALMTDNGPAMTAAETTEGLHRLSIVHERTLPYSPNQNGKQEVFWAQVEGRLMAMLEGHSPLTLPALNEATLAWGELDYNRRVHSETGQRPVDRFVQGEDVGRDCYDSETLRQAFTTTVRRTQRQSDGTVSLGGVRFEIPSRYGHLRRVSIRYAGWDLSQAFVADERTERIVCPVLPQDKAANAQGIRRVQAPTVALEQDQASTPDMAPLLAQLIAEYHATGLPPAYVPKDPNGKDESR